MDGRCLLACLVRLYKCFLATATAAYALFTVFGLLGGVALGRLYLFGKLGWFGLLGGVFVFFKELFKRERHRVTLY